MKHQKTRRPQSNFFKFLHVVLKFLQRIFQTIFPKKTVNNFFLIIFLVRQNFVVSALAQNLPISVDGSTNTKIDAAANSVPIVNIAQPNSSGLSHNKFVDYNVNQQGLIINNATGNQNGIIQTQIGGLINENPNLKNSGSASIILNEVTSGNISQLNGYTEIAGKKADLILANPNGFVINGAGFINVDKLTLVAGSTNQSNANLTDLNFKLSDKNYLLNNNFLPKLVINGLGIDLENVNSTNLVANLMNIVSPIYASNNEVNFYAGDKNFNYFTKTVSSNVQENNSSIDELAIDASNLGKIQAGRIFIIASKEGFGVKWSADLFSQRNGIIIDSFGNISYNNLVAENGDIQIISHQGKITQNGVLQNKNSANSTILKAFGDIANYGQLIAAGNINLETLSRFYNENSAKILSDANFVIKSINLVNLGTLAANKNLTITANLEIINSKELIAKENLNLTSLIVKNQNLFYGNDVNINVSSLENKNNFSIISAENNVNLNAISIDNSNGKIEAKNNFIIRNLTLNSVEIANLFSVSSQSTSLTNLGGNFYAGNFLDLDLGNANYQIAGNLKSVGNIKIKAFNISNPSNILANLLANDSIEIIAKNQFSNGNLNENNSDKKIVAGNNLDILAENSLDNYGTLSAKNNLTLISANSNINNYLGAEIVGGTGTLKISSKNGKLNQNSLNSIVANGDYSLDVIDFINVGRIDVAGNLTFNIANDFTNEAQALIYSGGNIEFNVVNNFINKSGGIIYSENNLTIQKYSPNNPLYNDKNNKSNLVENRSGEISSYAGNITINAVEFKNQREIEPAIALINPDGYLYSYPYHQQFINHNLYQWVGGYVGCFGHGCQNQVYEYRAPIPRNNNSISAIINSGGFIDINSNNFLNDSSSIIAKNNINIDTTTFNNNTKYYYGKLYHVAYGGGGPHHEYYSDPANDISFAGLIKSGQSINIKTVNNFSNSTSVSNSFNEPPRKQNPQLTNSFDVENVLASGIVAIDFSKYFQAETNQGIFVKNTNPNKPLFETRSQFIDQGKFFGSDYFYKKIGLNLTNVQTEFEQQAKRLVGDQFFQSKIIAEQLTTISKNSFLLSSSQNDVNSEIKSMLDNAADEYSRLGLTTNQPLTKTQINSLQKDIVWFESENIDGQTYIVPKVYLSKQTRDNLKNGSLANKSTIYAKEDLNIISRNGEVLNNGSLSSGGSANIFADGNIINQNFSQINASNSLSLTSNAGSIYNFSQLKTNGNLLIDANEDFVNSSIINTNNQDVLASNKIGYVNFGTGSNISSNQKIYSSLIETAEINAGSLKINAGNNFINQAAIIKASQNVNQNNNQISSGNIEINAGNDINILTLQSRNRVEEKWGNKKKGGERVIDETKNFQSEITAQGSFVSTSQNDTIIQSAKIQTKENLDLNSNNNLFLLAAKDNSFFTQSTRNEKTFTFKNNDKGNITISVLNNQLNSSSQNLNLNVANLAYFEYKKTSNQTANNNLAAEIKFQLDSIKAKTILTNPIEDIQKSWDKTNRGLTQTGVITVAIIVSVSTAGIGSFATIGAAAATAGATTAATIASTSAINASMNSEGNALQQTKYILKTTAKNTTTKESLESIAISATVAAASTGISQQLNSQSTTAQASNSQVNSQASISASNNLQNGVNSTNTTTNAFNSGRITNNISSAITKATINSTSYILASSAIKQESINDVIDEQGGLNQIAQNILIQSIAEVGAKEIGALAKNDQISKSTQLALHGILAGSVAAVSNDDKVAIVSASSSAMIGEAVADETLKNNGNYNNAITNSQISSLFNSLAISILTNQNDSSTAKNIQTNNYLTNNAVVNNALFYSPGTGRTPKTVDKNFISALEKTFGEKVIVLEDTLENNSGSRNQKGEQLANAIKNYNFAKNEPLILVGHSHGGNVIKVASNLDIGEKKIDTVVFLGTPHREDYKFNFNATSPNAQLLNVYDVNDAIQVLGGKNMDGNILYSFLKGAVFNSLDIKSTKKIINNFNNIQIEQKYGLLDTYKLIIKPISSHSDLDESKTWNDYVKQYLTTKNH
jgi:hypothetical protein